MRSTHSQHLETWLGGNEVANLSRSMRGWYGPPIALHGAPGEVYCTGDGDFVGKIDGGYQASVWDRGRDIARRLRFAASIATGQKRSILNTGFSSLTDLLAELKIKRQEFPYFTVSSGAGQAGAGICIDQWSNGSALIPPPGGAGSAAPGGRAPDNTTTGAFPFKNALSGDTSHFIGGNCLANTAGAGGVALLYDRIFDVAKTMNSTGTEAVTGVPTRYQGTSQGATYAQGNFLTISTHTGLPATAHNWTVCTYTDQDGNTGATLPSVTGNASGVAGRIDMPVWEWFAPLASGDSGILALTQMQCSALVATGAINFVIGHPIAWLPGSIATAVCDAGGIMTAFNLSRIFDNAALSLITIGGLGSQIDWRGTFTLASG